MQLVTNVGVYVLDSADGIPAAVKICYHCSATRSAIMKSNNEIPGNQYKAFDSKAQRLNKDLYTKNYKKQIKQMLSIKSQQKETLYKTLL